MSVPQKRAAPKRLTTAEHMQNLQAQLELFREAIVSERQTDRAEFAALRAADRADFAALRAGQEETRAEFALFRKEMTSRLSDLTNMVSRNTELAYAALFADLIRSRFGAEVLEVPRPRRFDLRPGRGDEATKKFVQSFNRAMSVKRQIWKAFGLRFASVGSYANVSTELELNLVTFADSQASAAAIISPALPVSVSGLHVGTLAHKDPHDIGDHMVRTLQHGEIHQDLRQRANTLVYAEVSSATAFFDKGRLGLLQLETELRALRQKGESLDALKKRWLESQSEEFCKKDEKMGKFLGKLCQLERGLTCLSLYYSSGAVEVIGASAPNKQLSLEDYSALLTSLFAKLADNKCKEKVAGRIVKEDEELARPVIVPTRAALLFTQLYGELVAADMSLSELFDTPEEGELDLSLLSSSFPLLRKLYRQGHFTCLA